MANGLRRVLYNDLDSRKWVKGEKGEDFLGLGGGNLFSSRAWIMPATVFSTGLLFREQINTFAEDLYSFVDDLIFRKSSIIII